MSEEKTSAADQEGPVMPWQTWQTQVLDPSVLSTFNMDVEAERSIAGAVRAIAAAAFEAGHRYGYARRIHPELE